MTPETMEQILEFCMGKIEDDDMLTLHDMLADGVPDKDMAADAAIKRRTKLAMDFTLHGRAPTRTRIAKDIAQDREAIIKLYPHMFRMGGNDRAGAITEARPLRAKRTRVMTAAEKAEAEAMFPNMKLH